MLSIREFSAPLDGIYLANDYLGQHETGVLIACAAKVQARVFIEFGTNRGLTAQAVLRKLPTMQRYIGVDVPPDHKPTLAQQNKEIPELAGIYAAADPRFELLIPPNGTLDLSPHDLPAADLVFIDGDHSFEVVTHDSHLARAIVKPGGLVVWHDYGNPAVEVSKTLDYLATVGWPICHVADTWLAIMKI